MTIGDRIQAIATAHAGDTPCGCVVCRAKAGEKEAWANVVAAMLLGCDFHGVARRPHSGEPYRSAFVSDKQRQEAGIL